MIADILLLATGYAAGQVVTVLLLYILKRGERLDC